MTSARTRSIAVNSALMISWAAVASMPSVAAPTRAAAATVS